MGILDFWPETGAPLAQIYNKLVMYAKTPQGQIIYTGDLATSWKQTLTPGGGETVRFYLYPNVTWHDGVPFTADDVKFSYEYAMNYSSFVKAAFVGRFGLQSINVIDNNTIDFVFARLMPMDYFARPNNAVFIYPKHIWEGTDPNTNRRRYAAPVGTGPYMYKEWVPNVYSRYVRNPNYFHKDKPYFDEVVFKVIPSPQGRALALQSGEINMGAILPDQVPSLQQQGFGIYPVGQGASWRMTYNFNESWVGKNGKAPAPWVLDVRVREAISHAVDPVGINLHLNDNLSILVPGPIDPRNTYFNPDVWDIWKQKYSYDPKLSEQLLDQAGWPRKSDGIRFSFDLPTYTSAQYFVPTIVEELRAVGIEANPLYIDDAAFSTQIEFSLDGQSKYPIVIQTNNMATYGDPGTLSWIFYNRGSANGVLNNGFYNNPEMEKLWSLANSQLDPEARKPYFYKGQDLMMNDIAWTFLFDIFNVYAWAKGIHGYQSWIIYYTSHLDEVWMEQGTAGATTTTTPATTATTPGPTFDATTLGLAAIVVLVIIVGVALALRRRTKKTQ